MSIPPNGVAGFATTRFVCAPSLQAAKEQALYLVKQSVAEEPAFSASPVPTLSIDLAVRVWSPFKLSRPNEGYSFFDKDGDPEDALHIERKAGAGWFG
jgi:hypothetical protein